MAKKKKLSLEDLGGEIGEVIKRKIDDLSMPDLIHYGFHISAGLMTYASLGRVKKPGYIDPLHSAFDAYEYVFSRWRQALNQMFEIGAALKDLNIPILDFNPFFMIAYPLDAMYTIMSRDEVGEDGMTEYWLAVPHGIREVYALMVPSLTYLCQKLIENTIELG